LTQKARRTGGKTHGRKSDIEHFFNEVQTRTDGQKPSVTTHDRRSPALTTEPIDADGRTSGSQDARILAEHRRIREQVRRALGNEVRPYTTNDEADRSDTGRNNHVRNERACIRHALSKEAHLAAPTTSTATRKKTREPTTAATTLTESKNLTAATAVATTALTATELAAPATATTTLGKSEEWNLSAPSATRTARLSLTFEHALDRRATTSGTTTRCQRKLFVSATLVSSHCAHLRVLAPTLWTTLWTTLSLTGSTATTQRGHKASLTRATLARTSTLPLSCKHAHRVLLVRCFLTSASTAPFRHKFLAQTFTKFSASAALALTENPIWVVWINKSRRNNSSDNGITRKIFCSTSHVWGNAHWFSSLL
jgi:hypothetical protein